MGLGEAGMGRLSRGDDARVECKRQEVHPISYSCSCTSYGVPSKQNRMCSKNKTIITHLCTFTSPGRGQTSDNDGKMGYCTCTVRYQD